MSYDAIASLQRLQQMQQAQAAAGRKLILKMTVSTADLWVTGIGIILAIPTLSLSFWALIIYFIVKEMVRKTYLVKNVATGEKFRVYKDDFRQYKKQFKRREKEIHTILDLEKKAEMLQNIIENTTENETSTTLEKKESIIKEHTHSPSKEVITDNNPDGNSHLNNNLKTLNEIEEKKEPIIQNKEPISDPVIEPKIVPEEKKVKNSKISFKVVGVTFKNDKGRQIQPLLRKIAREIANEHDIESYGGLSNKELIEIGAEASEFENIEFGDYVSFEKNPDNKFDKNAIKVMVNIGGELFHIGHVPKEQNVKIGKLIDSDSILDVTAYFIGGKTKEVDYDFEKDKDVVVVKNLTLGVSITLHIKTT